MENEILSKELEAALKGFQAKNSQVPEGYFDQFELDLMRKIHTNTHTPKQASIISIFTKQKKYLVAASLILAIATGYLFYNKTAGYKNGQEEIVQIEALPDAVIEAYVNSNELIAEADWNAAIEAESSSLSIKIYN